MRLRIVLESAPHPQRERERVFDGGQMVIGRSADADWQIDDPDMFVSRRHAILSEEDGHTTVTDASSGGLFVDNSANPLGTGNAVPLEPGMRLRAGEFTFRVEDAAERGAAPRPSAPAARAAGAFDFGPEDTGAAAPPAARPESLPDPFGVRAGRDAAIGWEREPAPPPRPLDDADPFGLDLARRSASGSAGEPEPAPHGPSGRTGGGYFDDRDAAGASETSEGTPASPTPTRHDLFADWTAPLDPQTSRPEVSAPDDPDPGAPPILRPDPAHGESERRPHADDPPRDPFTAESGMSDRVRVQRPAADAMREKPAPAPQASSGTPSRPASDATAPGGAEADRLLAALYRGMGLDPAGRGADPEAEMEQIGRSLRALVEGTTMLLRTRAQERQKVRVAQTILSSSDVNPLKFLATTDEALEAVIRARGRGYLDPEAALAEAFRDLADHQVRTWSALQTALRRMVDRFDPAGIAKEMEKVGLIESLIAGGRSAKLWQLYEERYREIARAAEEQFLGEVGADFRDAYETQKEGRR